MKVTPIEIRQKDFEKVFRGYEKEAVDAYLQSLSIEWERLLDENRNLSKRLEGAEKEVERLREVETSLFRTLKSAEETGNSMIESANKKAELYLKEAQLNAETMLTEARYKAKTMIEDAEEKTREALGGLLHDVKDLEDKFFHLSEMKDNLTRSIKNTINEFNEKINRHTEANNEQKAFEQKLKATRNMLKEKHENTNYTKESEKKEEAKPQAENQQKSETDSSSNSFFDNL